MTTLLIRGGRVLDGTGAPALEADVRIEQDRIAGILGRGDAPASAEQLIDASGCIVAPGFIDMHSHADWVLARADQDALLRVLLEQGVTTVVAGNCGFSPAPVRLSRLDLLDESLAAMLAGGRLDYDWTSMEGFLERVEKNDPVVNLAELVGHSSIRFASSETRRGPMPSQELARCLDELRRSFDEGACGLSLGLGYHPGMYSPLEELEAFCRVAAQAARPVTVHLKALSAISPTYPVTTRQAHNLRALSEMLTVARKTGIKLQLSHFIFVGRRSWPTAARAVQMVEQARRDGLDVMIDAFPYTCGNTTINVPLPYWFLARLPHGYHSRWARTRLRAELELGFRLVGFGYEDFQVMDAAVEGQEDLDGLTIAEIARRQDASPFDVLLDLSERSAGQTLMLFHRYSGVPGKEEVLDMVLSNPLCLFETDALVTKTGYPNPAALGTFPRILGEFVRNRRLFGIEDAIQRMTSASAERFGLRDRGVLARGKAADVVIFDPEQVADTSPAAGRAAGRPKGIRHVLVNGQHVVRDSCFTAGTRAGRVLRV